MHGSGGAVDQLGLAIALMMTAERRGLGQRAVLEPSDMMHVIDGVYILCPI